MALPTGAVVIFNPAFLIAAALVAAGSVVSDDVTERLQSATGNLDFRGAGTALSLVGVALTHGLGTMLGLGFASRPLALGMASTAALTAKQELL